jgi:hypothetical protein
VEEPVESSHLRSPNSGLRAIHARGDFFAGRAGRLASRVPAPPFRLRLAPLPRHDLRESWSRSFTGVGGWWRAAAPIAASVFDALLRRSRT